jgi:anaerobic selenocysteine-containing dehydrogenase
MLHVMIEENLYDHDFARDWTTAPFLVRSDTRDFLRATDLMAGADPAHYVIFDSVIQVPKTYISGTALPVAPALDTACTVKLTGGEEVECQTVFSLLREAVSEYSPGKTEALTGVPEDKIREAVRMLVTSKPACWYSWLGVEQSINASQTNRAICILYALTGDFDKPGGNVLLPRLDRNSIVGHELLSPEVSAKRLGFKERPLGPGGITGVNTQAYEVNKAVLTGEPYPVKALLGFGGNPVTSNPPARAGKEALSQLDFYVQAELFLTPSAELADIVIPVASYWESWHVGVNFATLGDKAYVQLRAAVVPPQHESWPDLKIIFELAKRLGLGDKFWDGDIEAGFDYQLAPLGITVEQLRKNPGGIAVDLSMEYQKYSHKDSAGNFLGFPTPSKRVEIYSHLFHDHGYDPLPTWQEPPASRLAHTHLADEYPLILTQEKVIEYCHSQHRALPSLRKRFPQPLLEINPQKARELGCNDGDRVLLETPHGSITLQAKLTEGIPYNVVCTQNGWWQGCPELDLPGHDPLSTEGANVSLLYLSDEKDPVSGSLPIKGYPCNVRKR